jgi:hypothetical protein
MSDNAVLTPILTYIRAEYPGGYQYAMEHLARLRFSLAWVRRYARPAQTVVDIGCFPFVLSAALGCLGYRRVVGLDIVRHDAFRPDPTWPCLTALMAPDGRLPLANGSVYYHR